MYIHEETLAGDTVVIRNHHSSRYRKKGVKRSPNKEKTKEAQEEANKRRDAWELTIRLNHNFHPGDYYITFTYRVDARPETIEEAKKDRTILLRRLRRLYKKNDKEMKFIAVTEYGKKGAMHHHMVLNSDVSIKDIWDCWDKGRVRNEPLDKIRQYSKLAAYIVKGRKEWKEKGGKGRMWTCSKNLVRPPTKKWIVKASTYIDNPRDRKNFYVDKESLREGLTTDGYPYQSYVLVRVSGGPP